MTTHIFAATMGGELILSSFHNDRADEAYNDALQAAATAFGIEGPLDEIESKLEGFECRPVSWLVD